MALGMAMATGTGACEPVTPDAPAEASSLSSEPLRVAAMGPLDIQTEAEWRSFEADLAEARALGIASISIDVWWGQVEREGDQRFDWSWVDRVARTITAAGLSWRPVLAFHACGSNVGDTCHVPIPSWVFARYGDEIRYVSAQGNASSEVISVWATPVVLEQYRDFFVAFAERYAAYADRTSGIAIGLGPASELRYPSYNAHDVNAGYPGPGVLQAYSGLARADYQRLHGAPVPAAAELEASAPEARARFYDWYRGRLLEHGRLVLGAAADVFQASPFRGARLSARVPGVHWRAGDTRRAELSAGLISPHPDWNTDEAGHGYAPLVRMLAELRARPDHPNVALEYTCLEKPNDEGGPAVASLAEALVFWVAAEAHRQGVPVGGENALAGGLLSSEGWDRIDNALRYSFYDDVTFLRLHDIVHSDVARARIVRLPALR